jgi:hypothetical protein
VHVLRSPDVHVTFTGNQICPGTPRGMTNGNLSDKRVEPVKERIKADLVDDRGNPANAEEVDSIVEAKAASLSDAPVQEFTPLLIEHEARDELRRHGFHRDLPEEGSRIENETNPGQNA